MREERKMISWYVNAAARVSPCSHECADCAYSAKKGGIVAPCLIVC